MAVLWCQGQPADPHTPYQQAPMHYQAVPMSPGWQMMVPASPAGAGYWSPVYPHPQMGMEYWARPFHPPNMSPQAHPPEHLRHGKPQGSSSGPITHSPPSPQACTPPQTRTWLPDRPSRHFSQSSSPLGHHSAKGRPQGMPSASSRPASAAVSNNSRFIEATRQNHAVLSQAAQEDTAEEGSQLQAMGRWAATVQSRARQHAQHGNEQERQSRNWRSRKGRNRLTAQRSTGKCLIKPHDRHAEDNENGNGASCASPDRSTRLQKDFRDPLLNARSRRSLRRAVQRAVNEAARAGAQLSAELEELPQLNSSPQGA
ncbi:hypothetical protein CVIRNUC_006170 [Coccomyxa viridis]|uniref:Uncharacterized protein n=1 Tax=Coccomyxa viridis TaxID=1274662 RepID=A0AAV1IAB8_9CHLO|nr:hypothetical protein CVIRNUC_006170 [Coccomyxa viridis]